MAHWQPDRPVAVLNKRRDTGKFKSKRSEFNARYKEAHRHQNAKFCSLYQILKRFRKRLKRNSFNIKSFAKRSHIKIKISLKLENDFSRAVELSHVWS